MVKSIIFILCNVHSIVDKGVICGHRTESVSGPIAVTRMMDVQIYLACPSHVINSVVYITLSKAKFLCLQTLK